MILAKVRNLKCDTMIKGVNHEQDLCRCRCG
jgi:hypothetical protein